MLEIIEASTVASRTRSKLLSAHRSCSMARAPAMPRAYPKPQPQAETSPAASLKKHRLRRYTNTDSGAAHHMQKSKTVVQKETSVARLYLEGQGHPGNPIAGQRCRAELPGIFHNFGYLVLCLLCPSYIAVAVRIHMSILWKQALVSRPEAGSTALGPIVPGSAPLWP